MGSSPRSTPNRLNVTERRAYPQPIHSHAPITPYQKANETKKAPLSVMAKFFLHLSATKKQEGIGGLQSVPQTSHAKNSRSPLSHSSSFYLANLCTPALFIMSDLVSWWFSVPWKGILLLSTWQVKLGFRNSWSFMHLDLLQRHHLHLQLN